jgi:hypothetical protein
MPTSNRRHNGSMATNSPLLAWITAMSNRRVATPTIAATISHMIAASRVTTMDTITTTSRTPGQRSVRCHSRVTSGTRGRSTVAHTRRRWAIVPTTRDTSRGPLHRVNIKDLQQDRHGDQMASKCLLHGISQVDHPMRLR